MKINILMIGKITLFGILGLMLAPATSLEAMRGGRHGGVGHGGGWGGHGGRHGGGWGGHGRHWGGGWGGGLGFGWRRPGWDGSGWSSSRTVYVEPTTTTYVTSPAVTTNMWSIKNKTGSILTIANGRGDAITLAPGERRSLAKDGGIISIKSQDGSELAEFEDVGSSRFISITGRGDDISLELKR